MNRRRLAVTAGTWLVLSVALLIGRARPAVVVLAGLVAAIAAVWFALVDLVRAVDPLDDARRIRGRGARFEPADGRWGTRVREQLRQARSFGSSELRDTLVALVDDRLRHHRRIDRAADPEVASDALTPALRRLVADPRYVVADLRELDRIVADIEAL